VVCIETNEETHKVGLVIGNTYIVSEASEVMYHNYTHGPTKYQLLKIEGLSVQYSSIVFRLRSEVRNGVLNRILE